MADNKYIVAIDQSTSGTKALIVNEKGQILAKASANHKQIYPQAGWVEHDPFEIYENVIKLLNKIVLESMRPIHNFVVLAITNQRETVVVWDKETGIPVYNAIVWQCRRTSDFCSSLIENGYDDLIHAKTGLTADPYFSASKVKWILDHVKGAKEKAEAGQLLLGTIDSWLIWNLTGGELHATDYSNASRTLLFNINTLQWDSELLDLFDIPISMLPMIKCSNEIFGMTRDPRLPFQLPISGVIGDSQGALFGQRCFEPGMAKATYGTGTSVMLYTDKPVISANGLVTSIAWGFDGKLEYVLEGIIHSTGDTMKWMKEQIVLFDDFSEAEHLASSLSDNDGVYLVPAFVGLGAPYWNPYARAAIIGISRNTQRAHIVRAGLESIAYQIYDILELMERESNIQIKFLQVDGGATTNKFLMQFQADMLERKVFASEISELSSMGSVYIAGLGIGIWKSKEEINNLYRKYDIYHPSMSEQQRTINLKGWKKAINCVMA